MQFHRFFDCIILEFLFLIVLGYFSRISSMRSLEFYGKMKTTNLFFIRHAESFNNCLYEQVWAKLGRDISDEVLLAEEAKIRQADCGVSDRGMQQLEKLQEFAKNHGFSTYVKDSTCKWEVFSSPMKRCLITTSKLCKDMPDLASIQVNPSLHESCGCFDMINESESIGVKGYTASEVETLFPGFRCMSGMEDGWFKQPVMESYEEFTVRAKEVLSWIWSLHDDDREIDDERNIIIVAHGNLLSVLFNLLLGSRRALFSMSNTGVTHFQLNTLDSGHKVAAIRFQNRVDHLSSYPSLIAGGDLLADHWIQEYIHYAEGV
jgi:broad specificity phosphatase PhoE